VVFCCGWRTASIIPQGGLLASKDLLFHQLSWWFIFAKGYKKTLERYAVAYAKRFSCLRKSKEMQCLVVIIS